MANVLNTNKPLKKNSLKGFSSTRVGGSRSIELGQIKEIVFLLQYGISNWLLVFYFKPPYYLVYPFHVRLIKSNKCQGLLVPYEIQRQFC